MFTESFSMFDDRLHALLKVMSGEGVNYAARGFSGMVGRNLAISEPRVQLVPLAELPVLFGGPESEAVGIYLRTQGDLAGQMMLVLNYAQALELVDLMMGLPVGETQTLGTLERSALAELGNLTGTFFLNAMAHYAGLQTRPTPPAVMVDMIGAILDVIAATYGGMGRHVLMLQVEFLGDQREVAADFCVIPDPGVLEKFAAVNAPIGHSEN